MKAQSSPSFGYGDWVPWIGQHESAERENENMEDKFSISANKHDAGDINAIHLFRCHSTTRNKPHKFNVPSN